MKKSAAFLAGALALPLLSWPLAADAQIQPELSVPLACDPDKECLIQQYVDMTPGPQAVDPFCGGATYDEHSGTDIRVPSLKEMAEGVPVLAMAPGQVLRLRDGEPDRLIRSVDERASLNGKDCGNGIVVDHGNGWTAQYCHLKNGSISVMPGQTVKAGDPIGEVGSSGFAQFPHLHVTISHDEQVIDPWTGGEMGAGCVASASERRSLWSVEAEAWLSQADRMIMDVGLTGRVVDHEQLVEKGAPAPLRRGDEAVVGWGWFANLRGGDRVRIVIDEPDGDTYFDDTSEPLARPMASYSQFGGRKRTPEAGDYSVTVEILRQGKVVETRSAGTTVDP